MLMVNSCIMLTNSNYSAKIVQTSDMSKQNRDFFCFHIRVQPILSKDNKKIKTGKPYGMIFSENYDALWHQATKRSVVRSTSGVC